MAVSRPDAAVMPANSVLRLPIEVRDPETAQTQRMELELGTGRVYHAIVRGSRMREDVIEQLAGTAFAAIVPADGGLIANLKVWENLVLPASYHGTPDYSALESRAAQILAQFGVAGERFEALCTALPDHLGRYERRLCAFVRALLTEPGLMVYDSLFDGLTRDEMGTVLAFDAEYRRRVPQGTSLHLTADLPMLPDIGASQTFRL
jgi:ABC-type transporter Mla maintaining outer membrane lipid asymmetry ATPase subunit MlaF